jgi:hypothetical protein
MTIRTFEPSQVRTIQEHFDAAASFDAGVLDALRALVIQVDGCSVLPLMGAGASFDCGMPLASQIGADLLRDYESDGRFAPHAAGLGPDLADVAEAIYTSAGQKAVVEALGLPDPVLWPAASGIESHFCGYRVLARLAREQVFDEAITLNYDCGYEAGLASEGFLLARGAIPGRQWRDHATLIADPVANNSVTVPGSLVIRKIHGCAEHYRYEAEHSPATRPEDRIVVRRGQLQSWRNDLWARDHLRSAARTHVLLLVGFSAQDPVIVGELTALLSDIYSAHPSAGDPRVVVVDYEPDTAPLRGLIHSGLGGVPSADGAVTQIKTAEATTTSALLVLLTETLAHRLEDDLTAANLTLPANLDSRLAALTVAGPTMLRWSYLLRPPQQNHFMQRINLYDAADRGYVPLLADPPTTALALRSRAELRAALGMATEETTRDALADNSFVAAPSDGVAYLPTGLDFASLRGACRPGGELDAARATLHWPKHLDCVIVADASTGRHGVSLMTGMEVPVP